MRNRTLEWVAACELLGPVAEVIVCGMYHEAWLLERRRAWRSVLLWGLPWLLSTLLMVGGDGVFRAVGAVVAVLSGGAFGRRLVDAVPIKVDLVKVFEFGPGNVSFWAGLEPCYHRRGFAELCGAHGVSVLVPSNLALLGKVVEQWGDRIGLLPAGLLLREDFLEVGLRRYVDERTGGAVEMVGVLASAPMVKTVDDVIGLVDRMSRKSTIGHKRDYRGTVN